MDTVFSRARISYSDSGYPVWRQPGASYEQNGFLASVSNVDISQINQEALPDNTRRVKKFGLAVLNFVIFNLNLSMKPVKKLCVYKCKLRLGATATATSTATATATVTATATATATATTTTTTTTI